MPHDEQTKIVVCGHVDHGKSTLIGRLLLDTKSLPDDKIKELQKIGKEFGQETQLAYLSDQLKEERERNITIETTQIFIKTKKRPICLIDTPGHLEFIKNMLSGASQADSAILIIDITEGIADQTKRHLYLLKFLGIENIVVLVNKMDTVNYSREPFDAIKNKISILFNDLGLKPIDIIPLSAKLGENISKKSKKMNWYRGLFLIEALDRLNLKKKSAEENLRLPVQDIYKIHGETIIVGKVASGTLKTGQLILLLPQGVENKIKAIKVFGKDKATAYTDESIGVALLNVDMNLQRGQIISNHDPRPQLPKFFQGNILWLDPNKLSKGQTIKLFCATQTLDCCVEKILKRIEPLNFSTLENDATYINENEAGIVKFKLLTPGLIEKFDLVPELGRFTIESTHGLQGAGTVLETYV